MRRDETRHNANKAQHNQHDGKYKTIAIVMAVFLVVVIAGGLYILNKSGTIDIALFNGSSKDVYSMETPAPDENVEVFTMEPEITPNFTPEPTEKVYIPDIGDLGELPDPTIIRLTDDKLNIEIMSDAAIVSWDEYEGASYYVLAVYSSAYNEMQKDILWSNITTWQIPGFKSGKVVLYVYKDGGADGVGDDSTVDIFSYEIHPADGEEISFDPASLKYKLVVDKSSFAMGVFTQDETGQYNNLIHTFPCGLGETDRLTAIGTWEISSKGPWKAWTTGWFSPYYSRFTAGLYIHGCVYSEADFSTLSYLSYEKIGTKSTSGCIRTTVEAAEWIYYNCPAGTIIDIVENDDRLVYPGKPAVDPDYTNWDPTDPNKPGNKS